VNKREKNRIFSFFVIRPANICIFIRVFCLFGLVHIF